MKPNDEIMGNGLHALDVGTKDDALSLASNALDYSRYTPKKSPTVMQYLNLTGKPTKECLNLRTTLR